MLYIATILFLASSLQDLLWAHSPFSAIWEIPTGLLHATKIGESDLSPDEALDDT